MLARSCEACLEMWTGVPALSEPARRTGGVASGVGVGVVVSRRAGVRLADFLPALGEWRAAEACLVVLECATGDAGGADAMSAAGSSSASAEAVPSVAAELIVMLPTMWPSVALK